MKREDLEKLERGATPEPWRARTELSDKDGFVVIEAIDEGEAWTTVSALDSWHDAPDRDGPLISAARNHLPALLKLWKAAEDLDRAIREDDLDREDEALRAALRELEEIE